MNFSICKLLLCSIALIIPGVTLSAPVSVDWSNSFLFNVSGPENPLLRVAFNPQPEPPAGGLLTMGVPPNPAYPPDPVITHKGISSGTNFRLLAGMSANTSLALLASAFDATDPHLLNLSFGTLPVNNNLGGSPLFEVQIELSTSSGGSPLNLVAFNPQPEPPALGPGAASYGADFTFTSFSDAMAAIRVHDANGAIRSLKVPEPPGAMLMLLALGLVAANRGHRHTGNRRRRGG